ncbi:hypothetical protein GCM10018980_51370 [Streptomyces capoamus]|uniref:Transcriptional regulator WhiB n=1 Tax=Streptomyces capoamus TaxID=68183 RepID=A0A919EZJ7_9ACTN|nr:WhiB family transcriptional regulator [Streptomyces capoamus]GGW15825.1 hypothetical protein GCM10010501_29440 [Streptomyces libani subsp. rufus]GHG61874.1 hypothetical protein GCM10018980_51370 [Streptomyces capoamus]
MTTLPDLTARTPGLPCRLDPAPFFSDQATERAAAVRLCRGCPLRPQCASYALEQRIPHGVWGGTTAAQRRSFHNGRPWRFDDAGRLRLVCGSEDAYRSHLGYGERPCDECTAAHTAHVEAKRRQRLADEHALGGSGVGYFLHRRLGEPSCEDCREALRLERAAAERRRAARQGHGQPRTRSGTSRAAKRTSGAPAGAQPLPIAS